MLPARSTPLLSVASANVCCDCRWVKINWQCLTVNFVSLVTRAYLHKRRSCGSWRWNSAIQKEHSCQCTLQHACVWSSQEQSLFGATPFPGNNICCLDTTGIIFFCEYEGRTGWTCWLRVSRLKWNCHLERTVQSNKCHGVKYWRGRQRRAWCVPLLQTCSFPVDISTVDQPARKDRCADSSTQRLGSIQWTSQCHKIWVCFVKTK